MRTKICGRRFANEEMLDEDLRRRRYALRRNAGTYFCGDEEMPYEDLCLRRNAETRKLRTNICVRRNAGRRNARRGSVRHDYSSSVWDHQRRTWAQKGAVQDRSPRMFYPNFCWDLIRNTLLFLAYDVILNNKKLIKMQINFLFAGTLSFYFYFYFVRYNVPWLSVSNVDPKRCKQPDQYAAKAVTSKPKQTKHWALSADDVMLKAIGSEIIGPYWANKEELCFGTYIFI